MHIDRLERVPLPPALGASRPGISPPGSPRTWTCWARRSAFPNSPSFSARATAGVFSADILADDGQERLIVIENQLEGTNHDHLGKLITYLSNLDAKIAVWVTSAPRPEHSEPCIG